LEYPDVPNTDYNLRAPPKDGEAITKKTVDGVALAACKEVCLPAVRPSHPPSLPFLIPSVRLFPPYVDCHSFTILPKDTCENDR